MSVRHLKYLDFGFVIPIYFESKELKAVTKGIISRCLATQMPTPVYTHAWPEYPCQITTRCTGDGSLTEYILYEILLHLFGIMPNIMRSKCTIVGDSTVGKTALMQMFISDGRTFPKNYNLTCGVDLGIRTVSIPDSDDVVELFLYDSSGRDLYADYLPKYWHEPNMILAVYDVTSQPSLDSVAHWVSMVRNCIPQQGASNAPGVLFGNKTDLKERRTVSPKSGASVAEQLSLQYFEGSAKENSGIEEPFFLLAHEWHKLITEKREGFDLIS